MNARKLAALRNLAERPGTPAEGELARELLRRHEEASKHQHRADEAGYWNAFESHMRGKMSLDDFIAELRRYSERPTPSVWTCACGACNPIGQKCQNKFRQHEGIRDEIRRRFKKGDRAYYNCWAYEINSPVIVTGYMPAGTEEIQWAWIPVKFDRRRNNRLMYRQIPIYSSKGWHLSHEPLPPDAAEILKRP